MIQLRSNLGAGFAALPRTLRNAFRRAARRFGAQARDEARSTVPVRTGALRKSIRSRVSTRNRGNTLLIRVVAEAVQGRFLERGAQLAAREIRPRSRRALRFIGPDGTPRFAARVRVPASAIAPRPFLGPALRRAVPAFILDMEREVADAAAAARTAPERAS